MTFIHPAPVRITRLPLNQWLRMRLSGAEGRSMLS